MVEGETSFGYKFLSFFKGVELYLNYF